VSPARARTSDAEIIAAARALLEAEGLDAVTMASVAERVGVKPPSLYKHVRDRSALLVAVAEDAAAELASVLEGAAGTAEDDPAARVASLAAAYRAHAHRAPRAAALLFSDLEPSARPPVEAGARAARPVIEVAAALAGVDRALPAARVLTAFAHGFTSMELAGAFRLGGDPDEAFRLGVEALARGLAASR
jgi:AcrR family transcriptional regulator